MKVHKKANNEYLGWGIIITLILAVILGNYLFRTDLNENMSYSVGKVLKITSGGSAGGLHFRYPEYEGKYNLVQNITWPNCRSLIKRRLNDMAKLDFPVVYSSKNPRHSKILIFDYQYEKYNVEIPKELEEIVRELSQCLK